MSRSSQLTICLSGRPVAPFTSQLRDSSARRANSPLSRPSSCQRPMMASARISSPTCAVTRIDLDSGASTRSEEHTSELQSLMRISYAVFCLKKKKTNKKTPLHKAYYDNLLDQTHHTYR